MATSLTSESVKFLRLPWRKWYYTGEIGIIDIFLMCLIERVKEIKVEEVSGFSRDQEPLHSPNLVFHVQEGRFDGPGKGTEATQEDQMPLSSEAAWAGNTWTVRGEMFGTGDACSNE